MSGTRAIAPYMVGRQAQLAELDACLRRVRGGTGHIIFVAGEPGIGKTRLLRTFLQHASTQPGTTALIGHCYEDDPPVPYGPFLGALRDLLRQQGLEAIVQAAGPLAGDLATLLPEMAHSAPIPAADDDPQDRKRRLFTAISRVLRPAGAGQCLVLVLEDLHWIDATSQELLRAMAQNVEHERLLILGAFRGDESTYRQPIAQLVEGLTRARLYHEIALAPLAIHELRAMLQATLARTAPSWFVETIAEAAGGNPFLVEEILRSLLDEIPREAPCETLWLNRGRLPVIPRSVKNSMRGRLTHMDQQTTDVLRYAAVIGRRFNFDLLARLVALEETVLLRVVERLVDLQLVVEERGDDDDRYSFRHALTREAIYDDLLGRDRRLRHRAVLHALEELHPEKGDVLLDLLAYHSRQAHEQEKAARYARMAGDRAMGMHAFREAVDYYQTALELGRAEDPGERAALLDSIGEAAFPLADSALYERCWREALPLYARAGQRRKVALLHNNLAGCAKDHGDHEAALAHLTAACAILEEQAPDSTLGWIYDHIANIHCNSGRAQQCLKWAEKARQLGEAIGDQELVADFLEYQGRALRDLGDPRNALASMERFLVLTAEAGWIRSLLAGYLHLGWTLWMFGEFARTAELLHKALTIADRHGWKQRMEGDFGAHLGYAELELGHWDRAQAALDMALSAAEQGHPWARLAATPWQGELWLRRGRTMDALRLLEESVPAFQSAGTLLQGVWPILARVRLALGDHAGACEAMDTALRRWREHGSPAGQEHILACAVEVYLAAGRDERAEEPLRALRDLERTATPAALAYLALGEGHMAARQDNNEQAAVQFQRAVEIWQAQGAPYLEAQARRVRAESLLRIGGAHHVAEAAGELATARAICQTIGAVLEVEAIDTALEACPAPKAARQAAGHGNNLTHREREVLSYIAQGYSNHAIAEALVIANRTVEHHVSNILGKLGYTSRTQAAAYAIEQQLAPSVHS
jgi:DNA-binding CsgD family transcriptional regulator